MLEKRERGKERKDMREREKLYLRDIYIYIDYWKDRWVGD